MSFGKLLHSVLPAVENERSPTVTRRVGRTSRRSASDDRRRRLDGMSATRRSRSTGQILSRQELGRQWPPAWTEFAWMSVARGNWQGCPWYEPNDEDRRSAKAIIIMGWCILPAPILSPPALRIRCQRISGQNIQHEWVNTSDPHWQFSTSHSYLRPDEHCYRKVKSHKG